jgi:drug/metabolite transporter (DMT)-like permease
VRGMTTSGSRRTGILCALAAACLFGLSAPLAKLLLPETGPLTLAGLLYLGAGLGLAGASWVRPAAPDKETPLRRQDVGLLTGVVLAGGVIGPVLLLVGLQRVSGVVGSLLLNAEAPLTMLVAAACFGEHVGSHAVAGGLLVAAGGCLLAWAGGPLRADALGATAVVAACASWALDTNLTQRLSLRDPIALARLKGLAAGAITLSLAFTVGQRLPGPSRLLAALGLGFGSYGVSVVLAVYALRLLGAARETTLFATAPFIGALAAVPVLGERLGDRELLAAAIMAGGVILMLRERHHHQHAHELLAHEHAHVHDEHHRHDHGAEPAPEPHAHPHVHEPALHAHAHVPDLHHRHRH